MDRALERLRNEYQSQGKGELYEELKPHLGGESPAAPYGVIAEKLGLSEGAVKTAAHRLRRRCRELLRDEAAQTVSDESDAEAELRELFEALEP
jgi:RNA polymerase sigma-70 factor (ECF subfamily)